MREDFIDYTKLDKPELLKLIMNRDEEFVKLGKKYLALMDLFDNVFQYATNEALKTNKILNTELMLRNSGVPSKDEDMILEKEMGKTEVLHKVIEILTPFINQNS